MSTKSMMVRVGADTRDMERGLSSAQKRIKAFRSNVNQISKRMVVAGAAVTVAVGLMVKKYVEAGDWIDKMAKRTGFGATALSELAYAADISGASLNDIEKGVKRMARTITDAGEGLESYLRPLKRIGLEVEDLKAMKPEQQFMAITEAIAALEDPTLRAATAQEIFGRAGTTLLPLMAEGKEGLKKLREEAHRLGIVFDDEAAAKAAKLKDAQTALSKSLQGLSFAIISKFIPVLTTMAQHFTDVFVNVRGNTKTFVKNILGFFKILAMGIHGLGLAWSGFKGLVFKIAEYAGKVMKAQIDILTAPLKILAKIPGALGEPARLMLKEASKLTGTLTVITDGYNEAAGDQVDAMADQIEKYDKLIEMLNKAGDALDRMKTKTVKTTKASVAATGELSDALDLGPAFKLPDFALAEEGFESFGDFLKAWLENLAAKAQTRWEAFVTGAREATSALDSVFGQFHENEARRIENEEKKQTDAIESWYERERERLEATITNEEEKVAALEALDEEKARKENALQHKMDKERRKLERKRARAHKVTALFTAGINMAEAITKAFTAGPLIGQILAGITAALCGVQIAAIAAAPLPALKTGGFIEKGGIARVDPGELVLDAPRVKALTGPAGIPGISGTGGFTFSPTVKIYTKYLDDYAIDRAAEKIFAALEKERERFG